MTPALRPQPRSTGADAAPEAGETAAIVCTRPTSAPSGRCRARNVANGRNTPGPTARGRLLFCSASKNGYEPTPRRVPMRPLTLTVTLVSVALAAPGDRPLLAQTPRQGQERPAHAAHGGMPGHGVGHAGQQAAIPEGWRMRLDRANGDPAAVKFVTMGSGWHVTTGPAAIFYRPETVASGEFRAQATLVLTKPSEHPEAFGLFVGGKNLDRDDQSYLYFLVRQDGKFLIKHRTGAETHTILEWTAHSAVEKPQAGGSAKNTLAVEAGKDEVRFLVNGQQVAALPRAQADCDGVVGLRINHRLDVHVAELTLEPKPAVAR